MINFKKARPFATLAVGLIGLFGSVLSLLAVSESTNTVRSLPDTLEQPEERRAGDSPVDDRLSSLQNRVSNTERRLTGRNRTLRNLLQLGRVNYGNRSGIDNSLKSLVKQVYLKEELKYFQDNSNDKWINDVKDRRKKHERETLQKILKVDAVRAGQIQSLLAKHRKKREEKLEQFVERWKTKETVNQEDRRQLEERLNRMYGNQMDELHSEMTDKEFRNFKNWHRTGGVGTADYHFESWETESEEITVRMRTRGNRVKVELETEPKKSKK